MTLSDLAYSVTRSARGLSATAELLVEIKLDRPFGRKTRIFHTLLPFYLYDHLYPLEFFPKILIQTARVPPKTHETLPSANIYCFICLRTPV